MQCLLRPYLAECWEPVAGQDLLPLSLVGWRASLDNNDNNNKILKLDTYLDNFEGVELILHVLANVHVHVIHIFHNVKLTLPSINALNN